MVVRGRGCASHLILEHALPCGMGLRFEQLVAPHNKELLRCLDEARAFAGDPVEELARSPAQPETCRVSSESAMSYTWISRWKWRSNPSRSSSLRCVCWIALFSVRFASLNPIVAGGPRLQALLGGVLDPTPPRRPRGASWTRRREALLDAHRRALHQVLLSEACVGGAAHAGEGAQGS